MQHGNQVASLTLRKESRKEGVNQKESGTVAQFENVSARPKGFAYLTQ